MQLGRGGSAARVACDADSGGAGAVLGAARFVGAGWDGAAMRYSVSVPNFGEFAAPEVFAEVARRAEKAGWDALLVGDSVVGEKDLRWEIADPWVLLTAAALATRRIRLGTAITPVARRRPSKLAREVTTLDRLTGGRMILGAGLGDPMASGPAASATRRHPGARRAPGRGLRALDLLWSGDPAPTGATRSPSTTWSPAGPRCSARGCRSGSAGSGRTRRRCAGQRSGTGPSRSWPVGNRHPTRPQRGGRTGEVPARLPGGERARRQAVRHRHRRREPHGTRAATLPAPGRPG